MPNRANTSAGRCRIDASGVLAGDRNRDAQHLRGYGFGSESRCRRLRVQSANREPQSGRNVPTLIPSVKQPNLPANHSLVRGNRQSLMRRRRARSAVDSRNVQIERAPRAEIRRFGRELWRVVSTLHPFDGCRNAVLEHGVVMAARLDEAELRGSVCIRQYVNECT